jgi:anhydro-N-acetylmuramic acid kinase
MQKLEKIFRKRSRTVIGLMSGTSCDGLDIALIRIEGCGSDTRFTVAKTHRHPYTKNQKKYLLGLMNFDQTVVKTLSNANFYLAQIWADAIRKFLRSSGMAADDIDLLGSHGQTVYHQPEREKILGRSVRSTLQIGDPAVLAQLTGIITIGDFRVADMALGGQAAPLVPYFDRLMYGRLGRSLLAVNIGGIANLTYIPAGGDPAGIHGFDTGPGNMLIDQLAERLYELPMDRNGNLASIGRFSARLYKQLVGMDEFPQRKPPKSTGREHYGEAFVIELLRKAIRWRIPEPDVMNTVTAYTAHIIRDAWKRYIRYPVELIIAGGGGSHNLFLMEKLRENFPGVEIRRADDYGVNADFKEAVCFGVLANELICGNPANLPQVTGSSSGALLGNICPV